MHQFCTSCKAGQYVIDPDQNACVDCPAGAVCTAGSFLGQTPGAVWAVVGDNMRVETCPVGYVLVRNEARPVADQCVACPSGKYLASNSSAAAGRLVVLDAATAPGLCLDCVVGATCLGGADVVAAPGYFVVSYPVTVATERRASAGQEALKSFRCVVYCAGT